MKVWKKNEQNALSFKVKKKVMDIDYFEPGSNFCLSNKPL